MELGKQMLRTGVEPAERKIKCNQFKIIWKKDLKVMVQAERISVS